MLVREQRKKRHCCKKGDPGNGSAHYPVSVSRKQCAFSTSRRSKASQKERPSNKPMKEKSVLAGPDENHQNLKKTVIRRGSGSLHHQKSQAEAVKNKRGKEEKNIPPASKGAVWRTRCLVENLYPELYQKARRGGPRKT